MAKNQMTLDTSGLDAALTKLIASVGVEKAKESVEKHLQEVGDKISKDTLEAVQKANLPAGGRYSTGETEQSVVRKPAVTWDGGTASIPVGFDFSKPGAGGWLISGTPKMQPYTALRKMYKSKKYMADRQTELANEIWNDILESEGR